MWFSKTLILLRAWWFANASNTAPPSDVRGYLLERIERQRQNVIRKGAAAGKMISTEAALKHVLGLKAKYEGPNRQEYTSEIDRFVDEFRHQWGPHIPVDQAYAVLKELEARFGRIE